jgi:hypothetical protein
MFKIGSHHPFRHLKHKLWLKEGPGVKLTIWLLTIKSQKSPWFHYVQAACNIPLEKLSTKNTFFFRPHLNRRSTHKVRGPQSCESPNFGNFGTFKSFGFDKSHLDVGLVERHKIYYKGEGGGFPQVWAVVSLVSSSCPWFVLAPKMLQLCTNHLVLILCRSVWVVNACHSS